MSNSLFNKPKGALNSFQKRQLHDVQFSQIIGLDLRITVAEMLETQVLDFLHQVFMSGMDGKLFQHLDENQAKDELHGQVSFFRYEFQLRSCKTQLTFAFGIAFAHFVVRYDPFNPLSFVPVEQGS